ncbi:integrase arm-type DNA-binding domain-containing protein [Ectothiorhodospira haloalkaliphila]|uniref:tyrosine-type recombinase/integrase n=1 Tax=Ectothiorhodospira haloalkaliphila TaxID=421628 RepID=UPI001EE8750E|nr:integrase arm-type DNA-binding domain-containing protein [Ectothiorhodospira haloalkaliphila]MCG5525751.1 integrase arm-type DNA-binding domain-containing protein [Ectothiorhodospira haloalkaliphila]
MPLTDTVIRNAKPGEKIRKLSDSAGLYLEISPSGGKWWRFKYRYGGKEKRLSLGVYPDISLKVARERRDEARKQLANGVDPSEHRRAQKTAKQGKVANSFEVIAREWHAKYKPSWTEKHADTVIRRLEFNVFPWLGGKPIADLAAPQILQVIQRIEQRGALETAHRVLGCCSQVFRYAVATGRADRDPCGDLRGALPPVRSRHFAAVTEPDQCAAVLRAIEGYQGSLIVRSALHLAPLVFVRPGELRKAEWMDFDLETAEWRYIVTKTNTPHIVPLSTQAVAILRDLQPLTGGGRYVFPSARSATRPMSDNAILAAMRRMGISKDEMTGHGFRAMARTILDEVLGFRPDYIEHQLAHAVRDPNGRAYNRTAHLDERRKMMQVWADYLDAIKSGKTGTDALPSSDHSLAS